MKFNAQVLEIELTDICNAACPMCRRTNPLNTKPTGNLDYVKNNTQITFEVFKNIIDRNKPFRGYNFCGNWGDPLTAKDFLKIIEYIAKADVTISIHTNGSLRSKDFYKKLGELLSVNRQNSLTFSIDGLKDTNHIYRRHTNFDKIIENAKSYIHNTKAKSIWMFIPFKHNEHQINEAEIISKTLGFSNFAINNSARFLLRGINKFQFFENNEEFFIEPPSKTPKYINYEGTIQCRAMRDRKVYLSCEALLWPCCWLETAYRVRDDKALSDILDVNDISDLNANRYTVEEIMDSDIYKLIKMHWDKGQPKTCNDKCGLMITNDRTIK